MDFSAVIQNEIQKKKLQAARKQGAENPSSKDHPARLEDQRRSSDEGEVRKVDETLPGGSSNGVDSNIGKKGALEEVEKAEAGNERVSQAGNVQKEDYTENPELGTAGLLEDSGNLANTPAQSTDGDTEITENELTVRLERLGEDAYAFPTEGRTLRLKRLQKAEMKKRRLIAVRRKLKELESSVDPLVNKEDITGNKPKVCFQIRVYIKKVVGIWEAKLRSEGDGIQSGTRKNIIPETKQYLSPLLAELRKGVLKDELYKILAGIIICLQKKNYTKANDLYMKLSIGNAAWPIGVTGVGIHARSALERITTEASEKSNQIAHIMADEKTRKWLLGMKRVITFCQENQY